MHTTAMCLLQTKKRRLFSQKGKGEGTCRLAALVAMMPQTGQKWGAATEMLPPPCRGCTPEAPLHKGGGGLRGVDRPLAGASCASPGEAEEASEGGCCTEGANRLSQSRWEGAGRQHGSIMWLNAAAHLQKHDYRALCIVNTG